MSGVVLRCPNCGTTRGTPGECDACHDAAVRYYCSNHSPGRWLEGSACAQCGAKFGDPPRPPVRPPPAPPPRPAASPSPSPRGSRAPAPPPVPGWTPRPPERPRRERTGGGRGPTLDEILREAARPRRIPREAPPAPDIAPVVRGIGGCLVRLVLFGLFLIVALFIGLFVFGGALLQMFRPYY